MKDMEIDRFFSFMEAHGDDDTGNIAELELQQYLGDKDLQVQSITMKQLFFKI